MADDPTYVFFDVGATDAEAEEARQAFEDAGIAADVSTGPHAIVASGTSYADIAFIVVMTDFALPFIKGFSTRAGSDAYDSLKRLIGRLREARAKDAGELDVIIRGEDCDIAIAADVPLSALGELLTGDLPPTPSGTLVWDPETQRWRDSDET